jgi:hypothetical protein
MNVYEDTHSKECVGVRARSGKGKSSSARDPPKKTGVREDNERSAIAALNMYVHPLH